MFENYKKTKYSYEFVSENEVCFFNLFYRNDFIWLFTQSNKNI